MPWSQLKTFQEQARKDAEDRKQRPPDACPIDGAVLDIGKDGTRHCPLGNFVWKG